MVHGGLIIRQARLRGRVTQRELARRLGTKQSVVARWESLATSPTVATVAAVSAACGLNLDWTLSPIDADLERTLHEQLRRSPADRVASAVNAAALQRA